MMLNIRDFEQPDLAAVLRLNVEAEGPSIDMSNFRELTARAYRDLLDVKTNFADGAFLVGLAEDRIVAMAAIRPAGGGAFEMNYVRIAEDQQRRGFGRQIAAAVEQRARSLGATRIVLSTGAWQAAAQRLYESQGYVFIENSVFESENGRFEVVHYAKTLEGRGHAGPR